MIPRYELKYWCHESEWTQFSSILSGLLEADSNQGSKGSYCVTSLYFDSSDYRYFFEKIEGLRRRVKIRLRRYESNQDGFLELKEKKNRRILKRRIPVTAEMLKAFTHNDWTELSTLCEENQSACDVQRELSLARPHPVVVIRYERAAFFFRDDPLIRVTVDRQLCCRGDDLADAFLSPNIQMDALAHADMDRNAILEVKTSGPVPGIIASALRETGLTRRSISKYCLCVAKSDQLPPTYRQLQRQLLMSFGH